MNEPKYLIWSEEHGGWWRPLTWGYTNSMAAAGRYSEAEAHKIVTEANKVVHAGSGILPDRKFNEIAIPDPLA